MARICERCGKNRGSIETEDGKMICYTCSIIEKKKIKEQKKDVNLKQDIKVSYLSIPELQLRELREIKHDVHFIYLVVLVLVILYILGFIGILLFMGSLF